MITMPRLAIGSLDRDVDVQPMLWGLMEALRSVGFQVQSFLSRACFHRYHGEAVASGLTPRHLDSWLMPPELCRAVFLRGAQGCDLAIVEGEFGGDGGHGCGILCDGRPHDGTHGNGNGRHGSDSCWRAGGSLDVLCDWLDLPRIAVLDARRLPATLAAARPPIDGVLLEHVDDECQFAALAARVGEQWKLPVLGGLLSLPHLRRQVEHLGEGRRPPRELCEVLGQYFAKFFRLEPLVEIASRRPLPRIPPRARDLQPCFEPIRVALAHDKAINAYFPDALELLEANGATIIDFSPLHDDRLPERADLVYFGCGHLERYGRELAQNHCMKLALREHACKGGRIYAEGGGLAYLCLQMDLGVGEPLRMAGLFPAVARWTNDRSPPQPVEVTCEHCTWLAAPGAVLRGYRNAQWQIEPAGLLAGCIDEPSHHYDLLRSNRVVGSQLHLDFAALPHLLPAFFNRPAGDGAPIDPWVTTP